MRRPLPVAVGVRGVLAGAYLARHIATGGATLTHAVAIDAEGWETGDKALCGRIKTERLCDEVERGAPTCQACATRALRVPKISNVELPISLARYVPREA